MIIFNETYSKLIKLISHLIVLSFNHENPLVGLDALSISDTIFLLPNESQLIQNPRLIVNFDSLE